MTNKNKAVSQNKTITSDEVSLNISTQNTKLSAREKRQQALMRLNNHLRQNHLEETNHSNSSNVNSTKTSNHDVDAVSYSGNEKCLPKQKKDKRKERRANRKAVQSKKEYLLDELHRDIQNDKWFKDYVAEKKCSSDLGGAATTTSTNIKQVKSEKSKRAVDWNPNPNMDLYLLEQYFRLNLRKTTMCSKGFKETDEKDEQGQPVVDFRKLDDLFDWGTAQLFKTIQVNTSNSVTALIFDIDKPYKVFEPRLQSLINDGLLPEPSYIAVRHSSSHSHVVYLLNKRQDNANTDFIQNKIKEIRMLYAHHLGADFGYSNTHTHNPFYQYLFDKRYSCFSDKEGFSIISPPKREKAQAQQELVVQTVSSDRLKKIGRYFFVRRQEPVSFTTLRNRYAQEDGRQLLRLNFKTYSLDELHSFYTELKMTINQKKLIDGIADVCRDRMNKRNHKDLSAFLNSEGQFLYNNTFSDFATGPDYRNNTLFYNALFFCRTQRVGFHSEKDVMRIYRYVLNAYNKNYAEGYPTKPPMLPTELFSIAKSVFQIHFAGQNYVKRPRDWHTNIYGSDNKSFTQRQKERASRSVDARRIVQYKRQEQLRKDLEAGLIEGHTKSEMVYHAAKKYLVSEKTIWRDLSAIEQEKEQRCKSFWYYKKVCRKHGLKLNKRIWTGFLLTQHTYLIDQEKHMLDRLPKYVAQYWQQQENRFNPMLT